MCHTQDSGPGKADFAYHFKVYGTDAYAFNRSYNFVGQADRNTDAAHDRLPNREADKCMYLYDDSTKPWTSTACRKLYQKKLREMSAQYKVIW